MPIELYLSEILDNPDKVRKRLIKELGSLPEAHLTVLTHWREKQLMIAAIKEITTSRKYPIWLSCHLWNAGDEELFRRIYKKWWHRIQIVIWNDVSPAGHRPHVRADNLDAHMEIVTDWGVFIDSDLGKEMHVYKPRLGKKVTVSFSELMRLLREYMEYAFTQGRFYTSIKHNCNWLGTRKKNFNTNVPHLSGVHCVKYTGKTYNQWRRSANNGMKSHEDIVGSYETAQLKLDMRFDFLSWDGCRANYYAPDLVYKQDAVQAAILTSPEWMAKCQQKRWRLADGLFIPAKLKIRADGIETGTDVSDATETASQIIMDIWEEEVLSAHARV